jgi:hypothetical protein
VVPLKMSSYILASKDRRIILQRKQVAELGQSPITCSGVGGLTIGSSSRVCVSE